MILDIFFKFWIDLDLVFLYFIRSAIEEAAHFGLAFLHYVGRRAYLLYNAEAAEMYICAAVNVYVI